MIVVLWRQEAQSSTDYEADLGATSVNNCISMVIKSEVTSA